MAASVGPLKPVYQPSAYGRLFHSRKEDEVLGGGAAGVGKTVILLMDPLEQIVTEHNRCIDAKHPHHIRPGTSKGWALHLRRTVKDLEQTITNSLQMFPQIDPGAKFDKVKTTWTFTSGYHFQFGHCINPDDWLSYYGFEFTHIAFDELVTFLEVQYRQICTRLRTSDPVLAKMLKIRAMSNPVVERREGENYAVNPFWVRDYFVEPNPQGFEVLVSKAKVDGREYEKTRLFLPAKLSDNPDPDFVARYERQLAFAPMHTRAALLHGNWYVNQGSYFGDVWNDRLHVIKPFHIPPGWGRFRSMDWGYKKPGCMHWWAMDQDGNLICERELVFVGKTVREVAKRIREIEEDLGLWRGKRSLITGPADTQLWEKRGEEGRSKAEEFADLGIAWTPADKKSRARNFERVADRLADHGNGTTQPGLVFFDTCKMIVKTLPGIQATPGDPDTPMDGGFDHPMDSTAYACAHASRGRAGITTIHGPKPNTDPSDLDDDEEKEDAPRGAWGYG